MLHVLCEDIQATWQEANVAPEISVLMTHKLVMLIQI